MIIYMMTMMMMTKIVIIMIMVINSFHTLNASTVLNLGPSVWNECERWRGREREGGGSGLSVS